MRPEKEFLTLAEVATRLGISKSKLYADRKAGRLQVVQLGRVVRIRRDQLDTYLRAATTGPKDRS
jgi:excisionase family DNA binding protein